MRTFRQYKFLTEQNEDRIQTIRNLLALATRPGTPAEGIAAREHAERLAAKYGIDLATITPEEAPKPKAGTAPAPPAPPVDPYTKMLRNFGWRLDKRPYRAYIHPSSFDLRDHCIVVDADGGWQHLISGNPRFTGRSTRDLYHHLCYNVS